MTNEQIDDLIERALSEDVGSGDVTTQATVAQGLRAEAVLLQKQPGVIFGYEVAKRVFQRLDQAVEFQVLAEEGNWLEVGKLATVTGNARALLTAERTALNILQHLSGIATATAVCVQELAGTDTRVLDTRKTVPGLRNLAKAAVAAGGGVNHRVGLYDAVLIKDNHIVAAGGVAAAVAAAKATAPGLAIELECASLEQVGEALTAGVDRVMLDNMSVPQVAEAAKLVAGRAEIEVSGGLVAGSLRAYALPGVNYLSIGAITHSAPALDISLDLRIL